MKSLRTYEQLQFADAVLFVLAENKNNDKPALEDASGAAGAFAVLIGRNESIFDHLVGRLVQEGPKIYGESIFTLRLMLAIVSTDAGNSCHSPLSSECAKDPQRGCHRLWKGA